MAIDFSTLKLPFEPGDWRDPDERMFHACFAILGQYVEDELGTEPWEGGEESMYRGYRRHAEEGDEAAIDLWIWYRDELPALQKAYDDDIIEVYARPEGVADTEEVEGTTLVRRWIPYRSREPKFEYDYPETVKDQKLKELIGMRRGLWT